MKPKVNRRSWKNFLINKKVQIRITLINLVFMGVAVILNTAVMLSSSLCNIYYPGESKLLQVFDMYILSSDLLLFSLAAVFVLSVLSQIMLTHHICGPLVNFTRSFKKISQGDLTRRVHLRSRDLLMQEANQFNDMVTELSTHIEALKQDNYVLLSTLKDLTSSPEGSEQIKKARELIQQQEHIINSPMETLKLPDESHLVN